MSLGKNDDRVHLKAQVALSTELPNICILFSTFEGKKRLWEKLIVPSTWTSEREHFVHDAVEAQIQVLKLVLQKSIFLLIYTLSNY